jgi:hypothetical protein
MPLLLRPNKRVAPFFFASVSRLRHRFPVPLAMEFSGGTSVFGSEAAAEVPAAAHVDRDRVEASARRAVERAGFESQLLD